MVTQTSLATHTLPENLQNIAILYRPLLNKNPDDDYKNRLYTKEICMKQIGKLYYLNPGPNSCSVCLWEWRFWWLCWAGRRWWGSCGTACSHSAATTFKYHITFSPTVPVPCPDTIGFLERPGRGWAHPWHRKTVQENADDDILAKFFPGPTQKKEENWELVWSL